MKEIKLNLKYTSKKEDIEPESGMIVKYPLFKKPQLIVSTSGLSQNAIKHLGSFIAIDLETMSAVDDSKNRGIICLKDEKAKVLGKLTL